MSPAMAPVAYTTTELAPASACAIESRQMFPLCSPSESSKESCCKAVLELMLVMIAVHSSLAYC